MRGYRRVLFVRQFPVVTGILFVGCLLGFIVELLRGPDLPEFLLKFAVVPVGLVSYFRGVEGATFAANVLPFFSSLFLHGGFVHLLANVFYLWLVGDLVEDWLGRVRFGVLFLFGAAAELIVRIGLSPTPSGLASVGISGGVAALIGGYVVILAKVGAGEDYENRKVMLFSRLPLILGGLAWFPLQLLNGYLALAPTCQTREVTVHQPTAWLGLLSSFLLGMFLLSLSGSRSAPTSAEAPAFREEVEISGLGI